MSPRYKCFACGGEFDEPVANDRDVLRYRSHHAVAWTSLDGCLSAAELRPLCEAPKSQLSMRRLRWEAFTAAVEATGQRGLAVGPLPRLEQLRGGHRQVTVRARVGQDAFRRRLLQLHGSVCALSGPCPPAALEAAHLYLYSERGIHHQHGGLLMRRDLHRLFDLGLITVDPRSLRVAVDRSLAGYVGYAELDGRCVDADLTGAHVRWLKAHRAQHTAAGRD